MGNEIGIKAKKEKNPEKRVYQSTYQVSNCVVFTPEATCSVTLNPEKFPGFYEQVLGVSAGHMCSLDILHLLCQTLPIFIATMISMERNVPALIRL